MRLFFTPLFVFERKQIAMIADEKSPTRISHRIFATSRSEMGINMNKNKYITDTKSADNTFTVGNVKIDLLESSLHRENAGYVGTPGEEIGRAHV